MKAPSRMNGLLTRATMVLVALAAVGCGEGQGRGFCDLAGGDRQLRAETADDRIDSAVGIIGRAADGRGYLCSGVLVGPRTVMTATVTGYGGPAHDVTQCLRFSQRVQDLSVVPSEDRILVHVDGDIHPGDSGGPLVVDDDAGPILVGILSEITSWGETSFGSVVHYERLRQDDAWVLDSVSSPPADLP